MQAYGTVGLHDIQRIYDDRMSIFNSRKIEVHNFLKFEHQQYLVNFNIFWAQWLKVDAIARWITRGRLWIFYVGAP